MDQVGLMSFWKNKNILLTGHNGFKGSWLSFILNKFEAILETFERDGLMEDTQEMRDFKNYLARTNETMEDELLDFVTRANL